MSRKLHVRFPPNVVSKTSKILYTGSPNFKCRCFTQLYRTSNKEKQCKFFLQIRNFFAIFFAMFWNFFNINVCFKVHSFSYNNSILHNFFINDPHWKKNMIRRSQKKILITEKMRIFYLNTTTKKSSRFITLDQGLLTVEKFFRSSNTGNRVLIFSAMVITGKYRYLRIKSVS